MTTTRNFITAAIFAGLAVLLPACGGIGGGQNLDPEPFVRERLDGKIPVKPELIRQQVRAVWDGTPEGEAEVLRWQQIETDYHACRLVMHNAKPAAEQVFADCMAERGYVYMYRHDAEQLHNDIEFEMDKERDKQIAAARKVEEDRIAVAQKAEEERIAAEKKRLEEAERARRQKELGFALLATVMLAANDNVAEIKRLIDEGADVNIKLREDLTLLHLAAGRGQTEIALALIKAGAAIDAKQKDGLTPLHTTALQGHDKTALALVIAGADKWAKDNEGWTPLHIAAGKGHTETAIVLVLWDINITAKDNKGQTALHVAAWQGQTETALALVKHGADIGAKNNEGWTPLHIAAGEGHTEFVLALVKAGADIEAKDNEDRTPLHSTAWQGYTEIALALIKAGADIEAKENNGWTPLHIAAGQGYTEIALALVKAGANIGAKDNIGWTPLHIAAGEGQTETALALVKAGASLFVRADEGATPLDIAIQKHGKDSKIALFLWGAMQKHGGKNRQEADELLRELPNTATAPAPEDSNVAERVFEKGWRSVVYIVNNKGQGSGVIIRPNIVATNCHVADGGGIVVYRSDNRRTDKSKGYRATIRRRDDKRDFCLLDVSGLRGIPANVRRYDTLRVGENVYGIGAPKGLDLSLSTGVVSQKRTADGVRYIQTDTAISPGSSGGGLFDRKGNLVGILTSKFVDDDVEGIGFAIPADLAL